MNYKYRSGLRLNSRNEGKIKSYESCLDVRAWSHDTREQDRFLREWIKADMPFCVIPTNYLIGFLRTMTCGSKRRATPQCHPDCKSKVLLDSLCISCHEIRACLKEDNKFDQYFVEEEFETCNWPCERCLEILKSIKMFWRIIIEKIFKIKLLDRENLNDAQDCKRNTVQSIAQSWQKEMKEETMYIKNISSTLSNTYNEKINICRDSEISVGTQSQILKLYKAEDMCQEYAPQKTIKSQRNHVLVRNDIGTSTISPQIKNQSNQTHRSEGRHPFKKVRVIDVACETCNLETTNDEITSSNDNINRLRHIFIEQGKQLEKLKRENSSLKLELENFHRMCTWKSTLYKPGHDSITMIPKPFEGSSEDIKNKTPSDIDSEMVITMKDGINESCRHISVFKILHKSKNPASPPYEIIGSNYMKENPMYILTKVQYALDKLVRREMNAASRFQTSESKSEITATIFKVNLSKSAPSCTT